VAERVRTDARVALLERTNLRYLELGRLPGGARVDLVTLDLSFISVLKVLPAVRGLLARGGALLVLIKPQFEAGRAQARAAAPAPTPLSPCDARAGSHGATCTQESVHFTGLSAGCRMHLVWSS